MRFEKRTAENLPVIYIYDIVIYLCAIYFSNSYLVTVKVLVQRQALLKSLDRSRIQYAFGSLGFQISIKILPNFSSINSRKNLRFSPASIMCILYISQKNIIYMHVG